MTKVGQFVSLNFRLHHQNKKHMTHMGQNIKNKYTQKDEDGLKSPCKGLSP
jgi:hypothetical protein